MTRLPRWPVMLALLAVLPSLVLSLDMSDTAETGNSTSHSRMKRVIYLTSERRLTVPPGTALVLTPTLSLPFARNLPTGYGASMTISIPFKIGFDDLGLTSEENPWGIWPTFGLFRKKRDTFTALPGVNFAGGDREMMYQVVEDTLFNMGMNGKGCLLRAICEMFQFPLKNHGFFGEVLELFFSASRSPHAEKRLNEYTRAERTGRSTGDCFEYQELCPHSFFTNPGQTKWIEAEQYMNQYSEGGNTHAGEKETKKSAEESPAKKTAKKNTDKKAQKGSKRTFN
ncbi:uncharacterized protein LOC122256175 isoform X2 [Penaeus japonicus]|nr:uncharacterized protein LOC122256175 isoform X2 [Penaeus japonicus]XP_042876615.1 uncharacterized protein LOC122256175 isoform X2 [Penaeus japonicus]